MSRQTLFKVLRNAAICVATLLLVTVAIVYGGSAYRIHRKHTVIAREIKVSSTPEAIERGRHIVVTRACAECHGNDFGGHKVIDDPLAGLLYGANLTRGTGGLPADYSDMDYVRAIRHGVARDGRPLVLMPSNEYATISDEDVGAIVAYLKTLPAVDRPRGPVAPGPIIRLLLVLGEIKLAAEEIDHNASHAASVTPTISVEYGKYLASSCTGCHGANLSGGKIAGAPPDWPSAANLTPHASAHIAQWTEAQFVQTLRTKQRPDGSTLSSVMPAAFAQMTDLELKALWSYIRSLPAAPTGVH